MSGTAAHEFPELEPCESLVTDGNVVLYRQIHPNWLAYGEPSSLAFRPGSNHAGKLSTQDGTNLTAEEAWDLYTGVHRLSSAGVWGITVEEAQSAERRVIDDAECPPLAPHHRSIDFRDIANSRRHQERASTLLKRAALRRGALHLAQLQAHHEHQDNDG